MTLETKKTIECAIDALYGAVVNLNKIYKGDGEEPDEEIITILNSNYPFATNLDSIEAKVGTYKSSVENILKIKTDIYEVDGKQLKYEDLCEAIALKDELDKKIADQGYKKEEATKKKFSWF